MDRKAARAGLKLEAGAMDLDPKEVEVAPAGKVDFSRACMDRSRSCMVQQRTQIVLRLVKKSL